MEKELEKNIRERPDLMRYFESLVESCPFCRSGSDALILVERGSCFTVTCKTCHCSGPLSRKPTVATFLWNEAAYKDFIKPLKDYQSFIMSMELISGCLVDE